MKKMPAKKKPVSTAVVTEPVACVSATKGECITGVVSGGEHAEPMYVHTVSVRSTGCEGLVFVSLTKPDIDALGTCAGVLKKGPHGVPALSVHALRCSGIHEGQPFTFIYLYSRISFSPPTRPLLCHQDSWAVIVCVTALCRVNLTVFHVPACSAPRLLVRRRDQLGPTPSTTSTSRR